MATKALYAGSFDPVHRGHIDIAAAAARKYGSCVIAVGINDCKKPLFLQRERVEMVREVLNFYQTYYTPQEKLDIDVVSYDGCTVDMAIKLGCSHIVRGTRGAMDDDNEKRLFEINQKLLKIRFREDIEQVLIKASKQYASVSSSDVKALCAAGEYILAMSYVFPPTHNELMKKYLSREYERISSGWWYEFARCFDGRAYHNLSHIAYMLNRLEIYLRNGGAVDDIENLRRAIFYHDLCETPAASADAAPFKDQNFRRLVMATDYLNDACKAAERDERVIKDLDLSILFDENNYADYVYRVREEYKQYDMGIYGRERTKVLTKLMKELDYNIFPSWTQAKALRQMQSEIDMLNTLP